MPTANLDVECLTVFFHGEKKRRQAALRLSLSLVNIFGLFDANWNERARENKNMVESSGPCKLSIKEHAKRLFAEIS